MSRALRVQVGGMQSTEVRTKARVSVSRHYIRISFVRVHTQGIARGDLTLGDCHVVTLQSEGLDVNSQNYDAGVGKVSGSHTV